MPLTRRVQVFISEEASAAMDRIRAKTHEGPTALFERLLKTADVVRAKAYSSSDVDTNIDSKTATSFNNPATAEKKEARQARKDATAKAVKAALPKKSDSFDEAMSKVQANLTDAQRPHSFHSGTSPISGCAECAKLVK